MSRSIRPNGGSIAYTLPATLVVWVLAAGLDVTARPACADTAVAAEAGNESGVELNEIVVHARKIEEAAVEVPLAITAVDAQQLREDSVVKLADLSRIIPNVSIHQAGDGGGTLKTVIRGQTTSISNFAVDPAVGYYFDGVYVAEGRGLAGSLYDMQSVEVSRGVQGTLNGRNNTGGAIAFYTQRPELGRLTADASVTAGNLRTLDSSVFVNVPLGSIVAVRADFNELYRSAAAHSLYNGEGYNGVNQYGWRVSALAAPSEQFSAVVTYEGSYLNQPGNALRTGTNTTAYANLTNGVKSALNPLGITVPPSVLVPSDFYQTDQYPTQNDDAKTDFVRGTLTYQLSQALTSKVILGYRKMSSLGGLDVDGIPTTASVSYNFGGDSNQFTVEPQLLGNFNRLDTVLGYFHFIDNGTYHAYLLPATVIREHGRNLSDAGYFHAEYALTNQLKFSAGARYTDDVREVHQDQFTAGTTVVGVPTSLQASFNYWSYQAALHYDFDQHWHGYLRTGRGQRSGGFSPPFTTLGTPPGTTPVAFIPFKPEQLTDYEIGVKTNDLLNGRLSFNADYYWGDYHNIQRLNSQILAVPGGASVIQTHIINAAAARVSGVETELNWRILPPVTLSGYATYTDAHYVSFPYVYGATAATAATYDLASQPFYETPKWMTRLAAAYEIPLSYGSLRASVGWNWQSRESLILISDPSGFQNEYSLVDARIAWTSPDKAWEVAAFGTNLTGTHYLVNGQLQSKNTPASIPTASFFVEGDPRLYAAQILYHFGK